MRGLTLNARPLGLARPKSPLVLLMVCGALAPRQVPVGRLTRVPLRDLELEAQYAEIKAALTRYAPPEDPAAAEGQSACRRCGALSPEERALCECGAFLHFARIFTCPTCSRLVERDARDCNACGASFWSAVNPPESAVTGEMVNSYLKGLEGP